MSHNYTVPTSTNTSFITIIFYFMFTKYPCQAASDFTALLIFLTRFAVHHFAVQQLVDLSVGLTRCFVLEVGGS